MKSLNGFNHIVPLDFVIQANKQRILIEILIKHGRLNLIDLSQLLNVSLDKLKSVYDGKMYLDRSEVELLAQYFCIFCGE